MKTLGTWALAALTAISASAVQTKTWSQNSQEDFDKATTKGVSLRNDGQITLAPAVKELYDPSLPYLWAAVQDSKGNLYVAGGGPGGSTLKVFRIDATGKASPAAEIEGLEIHALAVDRQDNVYAATVPDGRVWKFSPSGKPQLFYESKAKYIWALAFGSSGDLFVATGDPGEIHKVTAAGKGLVLTRLEDVHARSLAIDASGNLIVGTEPSGLVIRISPAGEPFVIYQFAKREVTAVAVGPDGKIYAAGVGNKAASPAPAPPPVTPVPAPAAPPPGAVARAVATIPPPPLVAATVAGGSDIVQIDPDGAPRKLWSHAQDIVYALGFDSSGKLLAGTGTKGAIYRIESSTVYSLLASSTSSQITGFCAGPNKAVYAVTGNVAKVLQIGPEMEKQGSVESEVFDAGTFSYWGRLNDAGALNGGTMTFETRSGNLDRPQQSWSRWAPLKDGRIASPPSRFIQWRAILKPAAAGASPSLSGVDVAWLSKNVAPRIDEVEATPANYRFPQSSASISSSTTLSLPPLGRKTPRPNPSITLDTGAAPSTLNYAKGSMGARWLAADENGDGMLYKLEIRGVSETTWKVLKDKIPDRFLTFDSTAFPDGEYVLQVTATDSPDNPPGQALSTSATSAEFLIDNSPPVIEGLSGQPAGGRVQLRFRAKDALNWIAKAEYSMNGVEWLVIEPVSKLSDSRELTYDLLLDRPAPGELTIAVRVTDEFDNQAVGKVVVK